MNTAAASTEKGWEARLELGFAYRSERSALVHRKQRGPLAVQRPFYPEGHVCHLYLLHPPGGVVGGDSLAIEAEVATGAHAVLTTPGATKFYLSAGETSFQTQTLKIRPDACLEWLPQENILFPGAIVDLKTEIELCRDARFIGWDTLCLGRPVIAERFDEGAIDSRLHITRESRPLLIDRLSVLPDNLDGAAGLRDHPVMATLVATPAGQAELNQVRAMILDWPNTGVTLLDDLLVVRHLGDSTEQCRGLFTRIWATVRPSVMGRPPCPPRIWAT